MNLPINMKPYKNKIKTHEELFEAFIEWDRNGKHTLNKENYAIEVIMHPNFEEDNVLCSEFFVICGQRFKRSKKDNFVKKNCFRNYVTSKGDGHKNGLFVMLECYGKDRYYKKAREYAELCEEASMIGNENYDYEDDY